MTKKIVSLIIILVILSISVISLGTSTKSLQDQKKDIENEIKQTEEKIDEIKEEKSATMQEVEKLNNEISQKEEEITQINEELKKLNNEISELEEKIKEQEQKYNEQYEAFSSRMVAQYKMGSVSYLDVLLNSKSLSDFISRYYIIERIADYDTKLLEQIEKQKKEIENSKREVEKKKASVSEKQAKLKTEEISLTNAKANKNKYLSQLNAEEKEELKILEELNEKKKQKDEEIKEEARKAALAESSSGGHVYKGGKLKVPCNYTRISSYFGYRGSAATGGVGSSNHKGMDFAAPQGTSIIAAEAGTVIKVSNTCSHNYPKNYKTRCSCGGGYGNYLMISHGGGLVTLYAHCTTITVSVGQNVSAGQQIATVGTTGYSTGNHLHFGVLLNGTYVNPASYLQ